MSKEPSEPLPPTKSKPKHAHRYLIIGIGLAIFNYLLYTILALIINNSDLLWLSSLISTAITTIIAYLLHSKITWKERSPGKTGIYKFFLWNIFLATLICPFLTQFFSGAISLYNFVYNLSHTMHLPFSFEFIQSTGAFGFTAIITTILNFFFYDRLVFGNKTKSPTSQNPTPASHQPTTPQSTKNMIK